MLPQKAIWRGRKRQRARESSGDVDEGVGKADKHVLDKPTKLPSDSRSNDHGPLDTCDGMTAHPNVVSLQPHLYSARSTKDGALCRDIGMRR